ncbi:hypothetical protein C3486_07080 [Streptomyces sp. Ru73]|nr:hypothetical protein C3486_07080 [Streptomyces sp. Ru73]
MAASVEDAFDALSAAAPKGWRVELIEGQIHVVPPPNGRHEEIVTEVVDQVAGRRKDRALRTYTGIGLHIPRASGTGKVIPDLIIAPKGSFDTDALWHDPGPVLLVGEVTSDSTAANDRIKKLQGYARAGIPCYLLIDRTAGSAVLCTEPAGDHYGRVETVEFSKVLTLPEPLGFDLDTSEF